jgi:hypothetical protein
MKQTEIDVNQLIEAYKLVIGDLTHQTLVYKLQVDQLQSKVDELESLLAQPKKAQEAI